MYVLSKKNHLNKALCCFRIVFSTKQRFEKRFIKCYLRGDGIIFTKSRIFGEGNVLGNE